VTKRRFGERTVCQSVREGTLGVARHSADASVFRRSKKLMIYRRVCFSMSGFGSLPLAHRKPGGP
jgi:hypothetical protein